MSNRTVLALGGLAVATAAVLAVTTLTGDKADSEEQVAAQERLRPGITAPPQVYKMNKNKPAKIKGKGTIKYTSDAPSQVNLANVSRAPVAAPGGVDVVKGGARADSKMTDEEIAVAQSTALAQASSDGIQNLDGSTKPVGFKPKKSGVSFDSVQASECCQGSGFTATVPPDPDMTAGPNHLIVVANIAFEIYDKTGNSLTGGAIPFANFFDGTPGCTAFANGFAQVFDPDVLYDSENDRFVIGIDGNGTDFCVAATVTGDPLGDWNRYGFPTNVQGAFFDFPHMGIGQEAIFMGSNQFGGTLPFGFQSRVFAMNKTDMYIGAPLRVVTREVAPPGLEGPANLKLNSTPQPSRFQPTTPHYIMTELFDGPTHSVYSWSDPFGADVWALEGDVDLADASGVPCDNQSCFPVPWPQKGSVEILAGNDFRGQETEYRNGSLWTTQTVSCNPGKGTVNCIRWAEIDPTSVTPAPDQTAFPGNASTDGVIQAGVFGSDFDYRQFPSIAVNQCGDMAVGYSYSRAPGKAGATWYPSIFATGRKASDPLGFVGGERLLRKGDGAYSSFQDNGGQAAVRWGDYTGMALDPDGVTFWYAGEYAAGEPAISIISGNELANWGTHVSSMQFPGCN